MKVLRNNSLSMGLIRMNLIQAKQAVDYFESSGFKDIKNTAAYNLQQACEKLIKIQVYCSGKKYNNRLLYTHKLNDLYNYATKDLGINLIVNKYCYSNFNLITSWEADSRYDLHFSVRIDTLKTCLTNVYMWYNDLYNRGYR